MNESSSDRPVTQTSPQHSGLSGNPPRPPTAVGIMHPQGEVLLVNRTDIAWRVERYEDMITSIGPRDEHVAYIQRVGPLVVTPEPSAGLDAVLTEVLGEESWGVEIDTDWGHQGTFRTRALSRRPCAADALPGSASIEELNLMASTENALKGLGVLTLDDALRTQADDMLSLPKYPLCDLFDLCEQLHGLQIT